ncbi:monocyte to macrophage differentiation factor isoform X4 [Meleagris gallopavo]|uniref:monocyte to macrophage differentiation factor isoform X4 n=1 Tax=Meleagris gallopavo TaxID=9103 RepID=UPI0012ABF056|nr:monocyte to macrophage differentiation factor isoform X4 [Meleagris gallopavo]
MLIKTSGFCVEEGEGSQQGVCSRGPGQQPAPHPAGGDAAGHPGHPLGKGARLCLRNLPRPAGEKDYCGVRAPCSADPPASAPLFTLRLQKDNEFTRFNAGSKKAVTSEVRRLGVERSSTCQTRFPCLINAPRCSACLSAVLHRLRTSQATVCLSAAPTEPVTTSSSEKFMNHPAPANSRYKPTCYEHAANCYTHAFLIVPAIVGSALLHRLSDDRWEKITAWIYGMGLCALFIVSTVFHIVSWKKSHLRTMEHCFHMCDRMMIYVFIAASYAPWLNLRELGPLASHMRWFIWLMAAGGTVYVFLYHEKYKIVELFFYLAMGFSPALVVTSMSNTEGLEEVAWGGLIYCLGVVFFKSDGVIPFAHAIWHVFVATAAAVHYYAIWKYLYRSPADIIRHL